MKPVNILSANPELMLSQDPLNFEATFKRGTEWVPNRAQQNDSYLFSIHAKDKKTWSPIFLSSS